jgi:hypothetical protein
MPVDIIPSDLEIRQLAAANLQLMANHNNTEAVARYTLESGAWVDARHLEIWNKWPPYSSAGPLPPPPKRLVVVWKVIEGYEGPYPILVTSTEDACPPVKDPGSEVTPPPTAGVAHVGVHLSGPYWQCCLDDTMPVGAIVPADGVHPKVKKIQAFAGFLYQEV